MKTNWILGIAAVSVCARGAAADAPMRFDISQVDAASWYEQITPIVDRCGGNRTCIESVVARLRDQAAEWRRSGRSGWSQREYHAGWVARDAGLAVREREVWTMMAERAEDAMWQSLGLIELGRLEIRDNPGSALSRFRGAADLLDSSQLSGRYPSIHSSAVLGAARALRAIGDAEGAAAKYTEVIDAVSGPMSTVSSDRPVIAGKELAQLWTDTGRANDAIDLIDRLLKDYPSYGRVNGGQWRLESVAIRAAQTIGQARHLERLHRAVSNPAYRDIPEVMDAHLALVNELKTGPMPEFLLAADRAVAAYEAGRLRWSGPPGTDAVNSARLDAARDACTYIDLAVILRELDAERWERAAVRCAEHLARVADGPLRTQIESLRERAILARHAAALKNSDRSVER